MATKPVRGIDATRSEGKIDDRKSAVIPVIQEQATVRKRVVETGKVKVSKHVRECEEVVDIPHVHEEVRVDRVPMNQFVDAAPEVRTDGETTIIPVLEERYVVEKRLFLVEELHIRKDRIETHHPQTVKVLKEEVNVTRTGPSGRPTKGNTGPDADTYKGEKL
ncbi:MAG: YsnF/AvaK domain-containing protein [Acidobacteriota bacterium]